MQPDTRTASPDPSPIRPVWPDRHVPLRRWRDGALTAAAFGLVLALVFGTAGGGRTDAGASADAGRLAEVLLPH